jgi:hypothetical protein
MHRSPLHHQLSGQQQQRRRQQQLRHQQQQSSGSGGGSCCSRTEQQCCTHRQQPPSPPVLVAALPQAVAWAPARLRSSGGTPAVERQLRAGPRRPGSPRRAVVCRSAAPVPLRERVPAPCMSAHGAAHEQAAAPHAARCGRVRRCRRAAGHCRTSSPLHRPALRALATYERRSLTRFHEWCVHIAAALAAIHAYPSEGISPPCPGLRRPRRRRGNRGPAGGNAVAGGRLPGFPTSPPVARRARRACSHLFASGHEHGSRHASLPQSLWPSACTPSVKGQKATPLQCKLLASRSREACWTGRAAGRSEGWVTLATGHGVCRSPGHRGPNTPPTPISELARSCAGALAPSVLPSAMRAQGAPRCKKCQPASGAAAATAFGRRAHNGARESAAPCGAGAHACVGGRW